MSKAFFDKTSKCNERSAGFPLFPPSSMIRCGLAVSLVVLSGCTTSIPLRAKATAGHCEPPLAYRYDPAFAPSNDLASSLTPELLKRYPRRNLLAANAIGILPALQTMATLSPPAGPPPDLATELAVLKQRQRVLTQVMLASSTISSLAAELDCEGERADQMANHLSSLDDRRTQRLNVLSIAVGALSGIGTTISENRKTQYGFGIGGGLLGAGLGLLTLTQEGHAENFEHPRNLLADVWNEAASSTVWPPSVWHMLNDPAFSNQGRTGIAHNTRLRWQADEQLAGPDSEERRRLVALFFGTGGIYSASQLKTRANMLNELQSSVRLLNQELQGLLLALMEDR